MARGRAHAARRPRRACAAQLPLADKVRVATHVIDNDGDRAATEAQVDALLAQARDRSYDRSGIGKPRPGRANR